MECSPALKPDQVRVRNLFGMNGHETLEVNDALALLAGALADQHLIRGCNAVYVATLLRFQAATKKIEFLSLDLQPEKRLASSALLTSWRA